MSDLQQTPFIGQLIKALDQAASPKGQIVWIGFSGGHDSLALLHALAVTLRHQHTLTLGALHVNHQLNPQATQWAQQCQYWCQQWSVPLTIAPVKLTPPFKLGLEAAARQARYDAFCQHITAGERLLLAHHMNDQAETFLQRLFSGHGPLGLCGIPQVRTHQHFEIYRPLLQVSRAQIDDYLTTHQLQPIEDRSNQDDGSDRGRLRSTVIPALMRYNTAIIKNLNRSQMLAAEAQQLADELARIDLSDLISDSKQTIAIDALNVLPMCRRINCIKYWLRTQVIQPPCRKKIIELLSQLAKIRPGQHPECCWQKHRLKAYQSHVYLCHEDDFSPVLPGSLSLTFNRQLQWHHPNMNNKIIASKTNGLGLKSLEQLSVVFGQSQQSTKLAHRIQAGRKPIKHWLHDAQVPPWQRAGYPLIYYQDQLLYLPNLGCTDQCPEMIEEGGWQLTWST